MQHHTIQKRNTNKNEIAVSLDLLEAPNPKLVRVHKKIQTTIEPFQIESSDSSVRTLSTSTSFYLMPFQYTSSKPIHKAIVANITTKRLSEHIIKLVDSKLVDASDLNSTKIITLPFTKSNNLIDCERNLTKLTVFYSNSDKLTCFEIFTNRSLLRCVDDLLETKLVVKLSFFYHVQLQPLFIYKSKMICSYRNGTLLKWSQAKLASTNQQTNGHNHAGLLRRTSTRSVEHYSTEMSSEESSNHLTRKTAFNSTLIRLKSVLSINKPKTVEEEFKEGVSYLNAFDPNDSFSCTLITKKSSNRKKLIWKLFLILKNQTCIPLLNEPHLPVWPDSQTMIKSILSTTKQTGKSNDEKGTLNPINYSHDVIKNSSRVKIFSDESRNVAEEEIVKCKKFRFFLNSIF